MAAAGSLVASRGLLANKKSQYASHDPKDLIRAMQGAHNYQTTPFRPNYDLDADGLRKNIAYHADSDATENATIVVGAGLGEFFTLDPDEQKAMAQAAVAGAKGRMPVVVGAGGGYKLALQTARNAQEAGAQAILLFSPAYGSESADGAYEYFRDVARSVRIGVILYPRGKEAYWPDVIRRLAELPNVIGFKDASGGVEVGKALGSLIPDRFLWIAEGETHAVQALPAGARAYTTAVATFVPRACSEFCKHGVAGKLAAMNELLTNRIEPVAKVRGHKPGYGISGIKVALEALGRAGGPVRPPGTQVLKEDRPKIAEIARKYSEEQKLVSRKA
ncbi:MAG: hypothetical protein FJW26_01270 [Acidimicrobiia bacterium]|nr:hypothetical protein [Acidimicrobiia bacterium]